MNIIVIDNGTNNLQKLLFLLKNHNTEIINVKKINLKNTSKADLIILSGSSKNAVVKNKSLYNKEIELIKKSKVPMIGICLGFELISFVYHTELKLREEREKGFVDIEIVNNEAIFKDLPNLKVFESHRWYIDRLSPDLVMLAKSESGIEIIKHTNRMIYGFQFHPELYITKTCGHKIFFNLLHYIEKSKLIVE
ncbi:hypothetical protein A2X44_05175 [candidate division CPR3 bacterium GWF2_35_18]|uniref:Glutamine amidotransferase class-I n=1 Tax=candidate division CPR3 bacterium GW2011_GWF2_35_18 TaxID=1618350 RepID=A0A0G0BK69_UNCC3|nr:MAG: Glutamine amidotransferase class-I [candidate division CPR3 bacterium GW2011_GWF2_35_18]KKP85998.1 MAG: Glutamine amidotransferase class-I [candidate division CPR3 bacterium GW2011_GWE2_35_7]OGB63716.1 MAG: hypothetical protein A2X44_05175 [candidate division CPR3 bacterium GWF2_35_18]OGB64964.1 MAG: hypothetical protein A2250_00870 [candidate division CPR3 bacterium RIFOXYA2_FULL_35_13]OGB76966.1 MAG: hypothetical protein A2476_04145 [candidate division CPR3 bacterium RIFOXYC2_FULL_35_